MEEVKLTFIVPVYNVEKYINDCVESLVNQTYKNIEILLINDGSTDNSGNICDQLATKDKRIKVVHKQNTGVSDTRNVGFEIATGDYVALVDSDDIIHNEYAKLMLTFALENKLEMISTGFKRFKENCNNKQWKKIKKPKKETYNNSEYTYIMFSGNDLAYAMAGGKIYKRDKIADKKMDINLSQGEDIIFNYYFLRDCENVGHLNTDLYGYLQRKNSAVRSRYSKRRFALMRKLELLMQENKDNIEMYNAIGTWLYFSALESFYMMFKEQVIDREGYIFLYNILKVTKSCLKKNKKVFMWRRLFAPLGVRLINIFIKKENKKSI